jgi:hypothetical protein
MMPIHWFKPLAFLLYPFRHFDDQDWHIWLPIFPVITIDGWLWWLIPIWRRRVWGPNEGWEGGSPGNEWSLQRPQDV